jgi:hypothetical protein
MEEVLFPNPLRSAFMQCQWSRLFQWIRTMSVLELNGRKCRVLSADCTWCIGPCNSLLTNEERRYRRQIQYPFTFPSLYWVNSPYILNASLLVRAV